MVYDEEERTINQWRIMVAELSIVVAELAIAIAELSISAELSIVVAELAIIIAELSITSILRIFFTSLTRRTNPMTSQFFCFGRSDDAADIPVDVTIETSNLEGLGDVGGLDSAMIETFPVFVYIDVKNLDLKIMLAGTALNVGDAVIDVYEDDENPSEGTVVSELEHHEENRESIPLLRNSEKMVDRINHDNEMSQLNASKNILRSVNRPTAQLQRSHSTGHSLIRQGLENSERYMLRLPDDVNY
ncbi:RING-H2 finger protein ATL38-like [Papaver somniferum]|uniref:RING-H2 finger protein ATL38-like n=1 Tax=Papaver somniferum TaxID=3469 RepID=UPI000E703668|nr:RING-H2 finger protein ATL38-like [Papaver somniferum]